MLSSLTPNASDSAGLPFASWPITRHIFEVTSVVPLNCRDTGSPSTLVNIVSSADHVRLVSSWFSSRSWNAPVLASVPAKGSAIANSGWG